MVDRRHSPRQPWVRGRGMDHEETASAFPGKPLRQALTHGQDLGAGDGTSAPNHLSCTLLGGRLLNGVTRRRLGSNCRAL
jgi:hypothetical protein